MWFIPVYLIGLIVLLIIILVRQGALSRKIDEEVAELKGQLYKVVRNQEKLLSEEHKPEEKPAASSEEEARQPKERWRSYMPKKEEPAEVSIEIVGQTPPPIPVLESPEEPVIAEPTPVLPPPIPQKVESVQPAVTELSVSVTELSASTNELPKNEPPVIPQEKKPEPVVPPKIKKEKSVNYEKLIGENLFGKIGILIFVIGVGLFVKYAIDKDWINETMRTVLGFLVGSALLFIAERLREKYRTFSSLLAGGAFAVFYLTVSIAFHYYHLFSQTVAFVILVAITLFMSALAILYDRRELAIIALVGGFLAPFIVSTGSGNYIVLFTYIAVLNLGMFILSMYKKWAELPVISFVATYIVLGLYVLDSYVFGESNGVTPAIATHLLGFATLFYFIFLLPIMLILKREGLMMNRVLLSVVISNNFLFLGFGCLFLSSMVLTFKAEGFLSLFIAIVNLLLALWLKKNEGDYRFLLYTMIGLVLTFVSVTVPLQLEGHYITLFWASEMVLLLWLYVRSQIRVYEYATCILMLLIGISFLMDIGKSQEVFVTNLFVAVAAGIFAWLMAKYREELSQAHILSYIPWNALMWCVAVAVFYYTFMNEFDSWDVGFTEQLKVLFTVSCIGGVSFAFRNRFPIGKYPVPYFIGIGLCTVISLVSTIIGGSEGMASLLSWLSMGVIAATLVYVARMYYAHYGVVTGFTIYINILATIFWLAFIDFFLHQIGVWDEGNAAFSIGLAIAGFVQMLLGMRLHQKVLRIISLVVFGIVLGKLAVIDLWALPTIGKIIVFIMLGALLLVLSFLYQKLKNVLFKDDEEETAD